MKTRKEYLNGECTHAEYYADFITPGIKMLVLSRFSEKELIEAYKADEHLNSLKLSIWDNLTQNFKFGGYHSTFETFKAKGDYATLSGLVSILKQTAIQAIILPVLNVKA